MTTQAKGLADTLLLVADAEECRDSLKRFVSHAWSAVDPSPFVDGWCIDAICDHLTALTTGQIRFLLINIPPRHTKSTICSVLWPVWSWLHAPEHKFLCASYSLNLAIRDNLKKRNLINSKWFQDRYGTNFALATETQSLRFLREKEFTLSPQQNAKRFFMNDKMGYQLAVSVGSTTTGEGGSMLCIDDPHSASEAHGDADREATITWFREVWSNRMNDAQKDRMLTVGQRIHANDVSNVILQERPDWVCVDLPAEYEPHRHCVTLIGWSDPRKEAGELLWPERFNQETLDRYKRDLGSTGYAAQYQQTPVPSSGGKFKEAWFRYYTVNHPGETPGAKTFGTYWCHLPNGEHKTVLINQCWRLGTVDLAISSKQDADYTVFALWDVTPEHDMILVDVVRGHFTNAEQLKVLYSLHLGQRPHFWKIEAVAYQQAFLQQALLNGIPCKEYRPTHDKVARSSPFAVWMENGKVYFLANAPWMHEVKTELLLFPRGRHDDIVDACSMAGDEICLPSGPMMWSVDDDDIVDRSPETLPASGAPPVPSIFEGRSRYDDDDDEGTLIELEVNRW